MAGLVVVILPIAWFRYRHSFVLPIMMFVIVLVLLACLGSNAVAHYGVIIWLIVAPVGCAWFFPRFPLDSAHYKAALGSRIGDASGGGGGKFGCNHARGTPQAEG